MSFVDDSDLVPVMHDLPFNDLLHLTWLELQNSCDLFEQGLHQTVEIVLLSVLESCMPYIFFVMNCVALEGWDRNQT